MPHVPKASPGPGAPLPDLLKQASAILAREAARLPVSGWVIPGQVPSAATPGARSVEAGLGDAGGRTISSFPGFAGAGMPAMPPDVGRLVQQAHDLVDALWGGAGKTPAPGALPLPEASLPLAPVDKDHLRLQAHEFVESLLVTFGQATGEKAAPYEDKVPLIRCAAPVAAGGDASATVRVANEDGVPSEVSLYCTNFVADGGHEIPSLRVSISPRNVTIPAKGHAAFDVKIAVSQQTPAGLYSGLIQAMGSTYVKAVLTLEVL
jgi:hypothetical protein